MDYRKLDIRLFLLVCHSLSLAFSLQVVPSKNTITSLTKSAEPIKQALSPQMIDTNDPDPNDPADGCRDISLHKCGSSMVRVFRLLDYLPWQKSYSAKCSLRKAFFSCMKTEDRPCKKRHWRTSDNRFRKKLARSLWSTRGCVLGALPNGTHI